MAADKLVDSTQLNSDLTTVANAIRTKGGTSAQLSFPNGMAQAIADIPDGGASYVDITLTHDYTSGSGIFTALQTASGFDNCYGKLISPVPESGPCVVAIYRGTTPSGTWGNVYRRNTSGAWGSANLGTQYAYAGDIFRVWEVG